MTEIEGKMLVALRDMNDKLGAVNTALVGLNTWAKGKRDVKWSAYARVAGKMLRSLEARGYVSRTYVGPVMHWRITDAGLAAVLLYSVVATVDSV